MKRLVRARLAALSALSVSALAACGGGLPAPAEAPVPAVASSAASTTEPSSAPSTSAPVAAAIEALPTARVVDVTPPTATEKVARVKAMFENTTRKSCKIESYTLAWAGNSKTFPIENFSLAPGQTQQRSMRVHPQDGDVTKLESAEVLKITVTASCTP